MSEPTAIGAAAEARDRARWLRAQWEAFVHAGFDEAQADRFCAALVGGGEGA